MAKTREIRRRIRSIESTSKITRAMEMVAASKLRKAQSRVGAARPYSEMMVEFMSDLSRVGGLPDFPLLKEREVEKRVCIVAITGDRGLCGSFNTNVLKKSEELFHAEKSAGKIPELICIGKKAYGYFRFRRYEVLNRFLGISDNPTYDSAKLVANELTGLYSSEKVDRVDVVYTRFKSPMEQHVVVQRFLPIPRPKVTGEEYPQKFSTDYIFEPSAGELFKRLLPVYVETTVFRALLESSTSEQGARMTAMKMASDNAEEMISHFTLQYNRARQAQITQEISEIVGGAESLKHARG